MDFIRSKLAPIGAFLAIAGVLSILLHFFGYNLKVLLWIDLWGPTVGWIIRVGVIVLGAALFLLSKSGEAATSEASEKRGEGEREEAP